MRFTLTIFSLFILSSSIVAQQLNQDLKDLHSFLRKTYSYKDQISGKAEKTYYSMMDSLAHEQPKSDHEYFRLLAQMVEPLRDNHLFLYEKPKQEITSAQFADTAFMRRYRSSASFLNFPAVALNLDSLEQQAHKADSNSIEGIYYYQKYLKVAVYSSGPDEYTGVVLASDFPNWGRGQIIFALQDRGVGRYSAIFYQLAQKTAGYFRHVRYVRHSLPLLQLQKYPQQPVYADVKIGTEPFIFSNLSPAIQYLRLGSFATYPANITRATKFYEQIRDSLTAPYLIVDIRNNGGGGDKTSRQFRKLLKQYARKGKVYLLINYNTISNAEAFALDMRDAGIATLVGETTRGMITYGSNSDEVRELAGGRYQLYITDMKGTARDLKFEDVGVTPSVLLNPDTDWIEQLKNLINSL
ncbi:MAG: hypothetical protein KA821_12560 [Chitinophagaceae bacterium]|nr:hypothetical protein [Chitinophagaceae bacterium]